MVELDEERKAAVVPNLLVVLGGEQATQLVVSGLPLSAAAAMVTR